MGLIEISNVYNSNMVVSAAARRRPTVIGEPIVAVDLINTVATPGSAAGEDLLSANGGAEAWWRVENARVQGGGLPDIMALRQAALDVAGLDRGTDRRTPDSAVDSG